jgi:hypothetical protein
MTLTTDNEWTFIDTTASSSPSTNTMASTSQELPAASTEPKVEATTSTKPNVKPAAEDGKEHVDCTCDASMPKLARQDSFDSIISIEPEYRRPPPRSRPNYVRNYSPSPVRIRQAVPLRVPPAVLLSSTHLLEKVDKYDGLADLPYPARGSIYLTTYPYTDKDVKKWSSLISLGVEDTFFIEGRGRSGDMDSDGEEGGPPILQPVRRRGDRSPYYVDAGTVDLPSIYLGRALDQEVIPEGTENVKYFVVVQNRHRPNGSKLLVVESRKAAGIVMYYEALKGDSVVFVGAAVGMEKKTVHPKKLRKVETLEQAVAMREEGLVGIIC